MDTTPFSAEGLKCEVKVPQPGASLHDYVDRWSDLHISLPAAVVTPSTEEDIVDALAAAKRHGLEVVVGAGGHATGVPVSGRTLYLNLRSFNSVTVDAAAGTVTVGGGAVTGEAVAALAAAGHYTNIPNANSVGVVGAVLGGGSGLFNGVHGLMLDLVTQIRVITAAGQTLELAPPSSSDADPEHGALFSALCGAGFGLGVVTSMTMRAFPLGPPNTLPGGGLWQRRLMFPAPAIATAAAAYVSMLPVRGPAQLVLACMRAPPTAPQPGAPVIMLACTYLGSEEDAKAWAAPLLAAELESKAFLAVTAPVPFAQLNDAMRPLEAHGGNKTLDSAFVETISADAVVALFERWRAFSDDAAGTRGTMMVLGAWDTARPEALGRAELGSSQFFEPRERGVYVMYQLHSWNEAAEAAGQAYLEDMQNIAVGGQSGPVRRFANNLRFPANLDETFSSAKIEELKRVKGVWDPEGLFWSPLRQ